MSGFGLKSKIVLTVAIVLVIGMGLIDLVFTAYAQRLLIHERSDQAVQLVNGFRYQLSAMNVDIRGPEVIRLFDRLKHTWGIHDACIDIFTKGDPQGRVARCTNRIGSGDPHMQQMIDTGQMQRWFSGATWGIFWKQHRWMHLAIPLQQNKVLIGSVLLTQDLRPIYSELRNTQEVMGFYIAVNLIILTIIGGARIQRITVKPLQRLVKTADAYQPEDGSIFVPGTGENEYNLLSRSLNRMVDRIAQDKERLRESIASLEKANRDLVQAQREIIRAEKLASVGRLASGIAHEIGNPIGIINGYLELLNHESLEDADRFEYIRRAEDELSRINTIIRQLLDFSRPSPEGVERVAVHDIIADITEVLSHQPVMARHRVDTQMTAEDDIVTADPQLLRQVFLNLLLNAADAIGTDSGGGDGQILIRTRVVERKILKNASVAIPHIRISVVDNGAGIPEEEFQYIFDPFYTTKSPGKGTGLGLSVSYLIIDRFNGQLWAESKAGEGTTMNIDIPLGDASGFQEPAPQTSPEEDTHE